MNRFFCEGSELMLPMKIFARADREHNRRFATIHEQFQTTMGSFKSSCDRGACLIACYHVAMARCLEIAARANRLVLSTKTARLLNACFAPVGMGGWGLPAFCAFLTPESKDKLVSYTLLVASTSELIKKRTEVFLTKLESYA